MLQKTLFFFLGVGGCLGWISIHSLYAGYDQDTQHVQIMEHMVDDLAAQLKGGACFYDQPFHVTQDYKICWRHEFSSMPALSALVVRHADLYCKLAAAECMMAIKDNQHVPELINALKAEENVDTGDGIIHLRTAIIEALGEVGDWRAIKPLETYVAMHPKTHDLFAEAAPQYVKENHYTSREEYEPLEAAQIALQKIKERQAAIEARQAAHHSGN